VLLDGIEPNASLTRVWVNAKEDENGTPETWTLSAYAMCASGPIDGLELAAEASTLSSGPSKVTPVPCSPGKRALGLGGTLDSSNGQLVMDALFPTENQAGGAVAAWEDDTGNDTDWGETAYAICAFAAELRSSATSGTATGKTAAVSCAADQFGTGSGADITGGFGEVSLMHAYAGPTVSAPGAYAGAQRYVGDGSAWTVRAFAVCGPPLPGAGYVTAQGTGGDSKSASAGCPGTKRVIGTGFLNDDSVGQIILLSMVPNATLTSFQVDVTRVGPGKTALSASGVCAEPPPGLQRVRAVSDIDAEEFKVATASCPATKRVFGTGAAVTGGTPGDIVIEDIRPDALLSKVAVTGIERPPGTESDWGVVAYAICGSR
jgi:hypothetical protein